MKIEKFLLEGESNKSFIVHTKIDPFKPWHHHPAYALVLITKGKGIRMVGDHVDRYEEGDIVLLGPLLPHAWIEDAGAGKVPGNVEDEAFVIQFSFNFLGDQFFDIPEQAPLKRFLLQSDRGYKFYGDTKLRILSTLYKIQKLDDIDRLYALFGIFQIFSITEEYQVLASPAYLQSLGIQGNETMRIALQYIMQHFQERIQIMDLLKITNKSYSAFYSAFKKTYGLSYTDFLLKVRIDYACTLLTGDRLQISKIAHDSGFDNLANFNRQFKKIKGITPSEFRDRIR